MKYNLKVGFSCLLILLSVIYFEQEKYPMLILTIGGIIIINVKSILRGLK